jgi:hypothetical protein
MGYQKLVTNQTVWHGMNYPAGTQLVVDTEREQKVYDDSWTGNAKVAIWCFIVENGIVTNQRMQVWDNEVADADFVIDEMTSA